MSDPPGMLSSPRPAAYMWAKTGTDGTWHPLLAHLLEAEDAGRFLWDEWLPESAQIWLSDSFADAEDARSAVIWLCGVHDLGKGSPAFQSQSTADAQRLEHRGLAIGSAYGRSHEAPHATVGAALLVRELQAQGWTRKVANRWACLVAAHHGVFGPVKPGLVMSEPTLVGDGPWIGEVSWLLSQVTTSAGADRRLAEWANLVPPVAQRMVLAGLMVLADWLASNEHVAGYLSAPAVDCTPAVAPKIRSLGFRHRWRIDAAADDPIKTRFGRDARPMQRVAVEMAKNVPGPGLLLVEAPMGEGKTEAALAAAEILAARFGSGGVFVALPTQATSNQMFGRVQSWIEQLPGDSPQSLVLVHGKAAFISDYTNLPAPTDVGRDEPGKVNVESAEWFHASKRHLLAPFAVGTVDHLLLAAARVRFVQLRQLGLAGKVVIVDEVHAYDAHMQVFLRTALAWLSAIRVPVVLLSATLPDDLRGQLLTAYGGQITATEDGYPRLTWVSAEAEPTVRVCQPANDDVAVNLLSLPEEGLAAELAHRLSDGGVAVVIRNTVVKAQQTYTALHEHFDGDELSLFHARFTQDDRSKIERAVLRRFGPGGQRPDRHVLVATQVVEQSLDLDFDLMVSDLAPVDLLLQRSGRLHRHAWIHRPEKVRDPSLLVLGDLGSDHTAPELARGSRLIYGDHLLLRTAAWLRGRSVLHVPSEIPTAVEVIYGQSDVAPPAWKPLMDQAAAAHAARVTEREKHALDYSLPRPEAISDLVGINEVHLGSADADDPLVLASVRGGEASVEVLLLRCDDGGWSTLDGHPLPTGGLNPDGVKAALGSSVRLPPWLTEAALDKDHRSPWPRTAWLRRLPVLPLDSSASGQLGNYRLTYSHERGLEISRAT